MDFPRRRIDAARRDEERPIDWLRDSKNMDRLVGPAAMSGEHGAG
ncbi:hypothetical protein SAMN04488052_1176 [Aquisalimonas asiatica]|uniref:Uncharacterized protein n=1 Tax=Aquisalimonas asiatica TaxID=406100 RepID=A0A1H8VVT7_9GAMM|nr:hypothetical protein SAMN04488052_1176 [Aquisalimonas asiatica]